MDRFRMPVRASYIVTNENTYAVCGMEVWVANTGKWLEVKNPLIRDLVFYMEDLGEGGESPDLAMSYWPLGGVVE